MRECDHRWRMEDVSFGFVAFERCFHCNGLRTFFAQEQTPFVGEEYREGQCFWSRVENAQSFRFSLRCVRCGERVAFDELMGLLHCTECDPKCRVEVLRQQLEAEGRWILVGFGFIDRDRVIPIPPAKLDILTDYFNQRRHPSRPKLRLLSFELIGSVSRCRGDFLHDIGMLALQPPSDRRSPFDSSSIGTSDRETTHDDPQPR